MAGAARNPAETCSSAANMNARRRAMPAYATPARFPCRLRATAARKSNRWCSATSAAKHLSPLTTGNGRHRQSQRTRNPAPGRSGLKECSPATAPVAAHSTADITPARNHATHRTSWPPTARSRPTPSPTAHVAKPGSTPCLRSQGGHVKTLSHIATGHVMPSCLVAIGALTDATLAPASPAPSTWTLRVDAGEL